MKSLKIDKGLLDNQRFEKFQKVEKLASRKMSIKKGIKIMEGLLDSGLINELKRVQEELNLAECKKK